MRGIVVNSGNANVFTGRAGKEVVEATAASSGAAARLRSASEVFVSSTGVIGEPPPAEKIIAALPQVVPLLSADGWEPAARAIMTTDTFPKGRHRDRHDRRRRRSASTASPRARA